MLETLTRWGLETWSSQLANVKFGFAHAPLLMVGLSALLLAPILAILGSIVRSATRAPAPPAIPSATTEINGVTPYFGRLQLQTADHARLIALGPAPVRIGRQQDNELRLDETTVHGYHAVVERTRDGVVVITDISGPEGNGMRINGHTRRSATLSPGDIIELGAAQLEVAVPTWARREETPEQLEHA